MFYSASKTCLAADEKLTLVTASRIVLFILLANSDVLHEYGNGVTSDVDFDAISDYASTKSAHIHWEHLTRHGHYTRYVFTLQPLGAVTTDWNKHWMVEIWSVQYTDICLEVWENCILEAFVHVHLSDGFMINALLQLNPETISDDSLSRKPHLVGHSSSHIATCAASHKLFAKCTTEGGHFPTVKHTGKDNTTQACLSLRHMSVVCT